MKNYIWASWSGLALVIGGSAMVGYGNRKLVGYGTETSGQDTYGVFFGNCLMLVGLGFLFYAMSEKLTKKNRAYLISNAFYSGLGLMFLMSTFLLPEHEREGIKYIMVMSASVFLVVAINVMIGINHLEKE